MLSNRGVMRSRDGVTSATGLEEEVAIGASQAAGRRPHTGQRPASVVGLRRGLSGHPLVLGVRLQHEIADAFLRTGVYDGTQQREAAALTVDRILARRERDVAASTAATLPNGEADQL